MFKQVKEDKDAFEDEDAIALELERSPQWSDIDGNEDMCEYSH